MITESDISVQTTKQIEKGTGLGFYEDFLLELESEFGSAPSTAWIESHPLIDEHFELNASDSLMSYYSESLNSKAGIVVDVSTESVTKALETMDLGEGSTIGFITPNGKETIIGSDPTFSLTATDVYQSFLSSEESELSSYLTINGTEQLIWACKGSIADTVVYAAIPRAMVVKQAETILDMSKIFDQMGLGMAELMLSVEHIGKNIEQVDANRHSTKVEVENITEVIHETSASTSHMNILATELLTNAENMNSVSDELMTNTQNLKNEIARFTI